MDGPLNPDPRKAPRYSMNLAVEIFSKGLNHVHGAKTANVSLTGLFVCTDLAAALGEQLHLRVVLKDKEAFFDIRGQVVWVCDGQGTHPQGLGLQFVNLSRDQQNVINQHLKDYVNIRK